MFVWSPIIVDCVWSVLTDYKKKLSKPQDVLCIWLNNPLAFCKSHTDGKKNKLQISGGGGYLYTDF